MNVVTDCREAVYDVVTSMLALPLPTYLYLPGSTEELPCYVVGRPEVSEGDTRAIVATSVPVHVLGRTATSRDADAQRELDAAADAVIVALWNPSSDPSISMRLTEARPVVISIAGLDVPAYTVLVAVEATFC